jgi:hypothetical protein
MSFPFANRRDDEEALTTYVRQRCWKETQRLLPFLFRAFRDHDPCGRWCPDWGDKTQFRYGVLKYLSDDRVYVCRALMSLPVQSWLLRPAYPGAVLTEYG